MSSSNEYLSYATEELKETWLKWGYSKFNGRLQTLLRMGAFNIEKKNG